MGSISDAMEQSDREDEKRRKAYTPTSKGYTGENCNNKDCGRNRVIPYANGKRICEKCHWDQDAHEYDGTHMDI